MNYDKETFLNALAETFPNVASVQRADVIKVIEENGLRYPHWFFKENKVSQNYNHNLVLGADSVIDLNGELISKPQNREEAMLILKKLNGKNHYLISSVCISKDGSMIWNYTDKASLTMKQMSEFELKNYLEKISDEALYAYNVYQIEGEGRFLFTKIEGDENTIMGLPVKKIKEYLDNYK